MGKKLTKILFSLCASLPIFTQPGLFNVSYAQERHPTREESIQMIYEAVNLKKTNEAKFFRNGTVSSEVRQSLTQLSVFAESEMFLPRTQISARFYRGKAYQEMGNYIKAREDFQYIVDNEPKDNFPLYKAEANVQLSLTNHFNGKVSGTLNELVDGEEQPVTDGVAALFDSYEWNFNVVKDGEFSFIYEQNRLIEGTKLPMIFFSEGKAPVYKLLDVSEESQELSVVLEKSSTEVFEGYEFNFILAGLTYDLVEEEFRYGMNLIPNKQLMLGLGRILVVESDENGCLSLQVPPEVLYLPDETTGLILKNYKK